MSTLGLVVAAGGSSRRFGGGNKLFETLAGRPVFLHCLEKLGGACAVTVLVVPASEQAAFEDALRRFGVGGITLACGGAERSDSVLAGIHALPGSVDYVAIHDAARPLADAGLLARCLASAEEYGAAIAAHRVADTIKVADSRQFILDTPDRSTLWAAETPQVFRRSWIEEAYETCRRHGIAVTDDAQALKNCGHDVMLVENSFCNLKITRRDDLSMAEYMVSRTMR